MATGDTAEAIEEVEAVFVLLKGYLSTVATGHHVAGSTCILEAGRAGHTPCNLGTAVRRSRDSEFKDCPPRFTIQNEPKP